MELKKLLPWNWGKKEKVESPDVKAIIKINPVAKENGIYDDENKIIEVTRYGQVERIKYSEADVEALREQGIPVIEEEYSDNMDWTDLETGGIEFKK